MRAEASQRRTASQAVLENLSSIATAAIKGSAAPVLLEAVHSSQGTAAPAATSGRASAGLATVLNAYREQATATAA